MKTLCIVGPTGVGKTEAAEKIASVLGGDIINMDVGQMYTHIAVGTAKPSWKNHSIPHHMFDVLDQPVNPCVTEYRSKVASIVNTIHAQGKVAVLVGGSLFYLKSLLFALQDINQAIDLPEGVPVSWESLHTIDPERALAIHPMDTYRIERALSIWYASGVKPSLHKPQWSPIQPQINILWLYRTQEDLHSRIDSRVDSMIHNGWLEEVNNLDADWKEFVLRKKLCGYNIVAQACLANRSLGHDSQLIKYATRVYAKKQRIFWASLKKSCAPYLENDICISEQNLTFHSIDLYLEQMTMDQGSKK